MSYHLEYVDKPARFDEVVEQDGVKVLIDSKALFSIIGSEMDWKVDRLRYVSDLVVVRGGDLWDVVRNSLSRIRILKMLVVAESHSPLHDNPPNHHYLSSYLFHPHRSFVPPTLSTVSLDNS